MIQNRESRAMIQSAGKKKFRCVCNEMSLDQPQAIMFLSSQVVQSKLYINIIKLESFGIFGLVNIHSVIRRVNDYIMDLQTCTKNGANLL